MLDGESTRCARSRGLPCTEYYAAGLELGAFQKTTTAQERSGQFADRSWAGLI